MLAARAATLRYKQLLGLLCFAFILEVGEGRREQGNDELDKSVCLESEAESHANLMINNQSPFNIHLKKKSNHRYQG
jgi:hypothetical protein